MVKMCHSISRKIRVTFNSTVAAILANIGNPSAKFFPGFPLANTTSDFNGTVFSTVKLVNTQWNAALLTLPDRYYSQQFKHTLWTLT